ncbi:LytTR family DNA-binding domain-containing protein [Proteiniphilum sp.]|uniref:LytTR family DNA-binding domain-containing protein n=1 Tax=Proteiniphilum sp. TaxID=1926877 RepID=UPI002B1EB4F9|nr:LytTR family DNA-binding domain-containing protein [Proteiniphilum sp.]MEA4917551.1 LytTR family DNA-binding domain-containing protein [Proteiniphilum sp.]
MLVLISSDDITYVYSQNKKVEIVCFSKREFTMDNSLDDFLAQLDPERFFRANRQFIISHKAITDL